MNCQHIQRAISRHFNPHANLVIPNCCTALAWEADLLVVRKSGWAEEIEIKVSVADFRREFTTKALKHRVLVDGTPALRRSWKTPGFKPRDPGNPQHVPLTPGSPLHSMYHDFSEVSRHIVKRFWYAMPEELADKLADEIPSYAGLMVVSSGGYLCNPIRKEAPVINMSRKVTDAERSSLYRACYYRFWDLKRAMERKEQAA